MVSDASGRDLFFKTTSTNNVETRIYLRLVIYTRRDYDHALTLNFPNFQSGYLSRIMFEFALERSSNQQDSVAFTRAKETTEPRSRRKERPRGNKGAEVSETGGKKQARANSRWRPVVPTGDTGVLNRAMTR